MLTKSYCGKDIYCNKKGITRVRKERLPTGSILQWILSQGQGRLPIGFYI